jgi:dihydrodipicolinate synthase/N-acetylneuraminate lyase
VSPNRISGTLAAAVTPLRDGGERLDEEAFETLLAFYASSGVEGVLMMGTTGEGILLDSGERRRAAELAIAAAQELRVIVHSGAQTTAETCALAAHAAEAGADAVAVIAPPYFAFTPEELLEHFAAAAAACAPLPFYAYEYADRSGYTVPVAVVEGIGERAPNLAGMKVSDAPFERVRPYLEIGLDIFIGAEAVIVEGLAAGAAGAVSGIAAAFPEAVSALVREPAADRAAVVESLRRLLERRPFQASVKAALGCRGIAVRPDVRAPLKPLDAAAIDELRAELETLLGADALARGVRA